MQTLFRQMMVVLLAAALPAALAGWFHPRKPDWHPTKLQDGEVELSTVEQWNNVLWVDARTSREYDTGHIPGAILLNEDSWDRLLPSLLIVIKPGQPVVVYCSAQCHSSESVAERLRKSGMGPIYVLKGGWEAWTYQKKL